MGLLGPRWNVLLIGLQAKGADNYEEGTCWWVVVQLERITRPSQVRDGDPVTEERARLVIHLAWKATGSSNMSVHM